MSDPAILWTTQSMEFSRLQYWSGKPFPSPRDLPNPEIKPRSPALQADSLPAGPRGKPNKDRSRNDEGEEKVERIRVLTIKQSK